MLLTAALLYLALMAVPRAPAWWLTLPWAVRDLTAPLAVGGGAACLGLGQPLAGGLLILGALAGLVRRDMDGIPRLTEVGEEALRLMASLYPEEREAVYWENYGKWLMNGYPLGSVPFSPAPASQEGQSPA